MIRNVYETPIGKGRFDSSDFRKKYQSEYEAGRVGIPWLVEYWWNWE
jgi:hypothetical protein